MLNSPSNSLWIEASELWLTVVSENKILSDSFKLDFHQHTMSPFDFWILYGNLNLLFARHSAQNKTLFRTSPLFIQI